MKSLLYGIAALPFFVGAAAAEPTHLTNTQMDKVTAGWSLFETDLSNTSWTQVSVWNGPLAVTSGATSCGSCYLVIINPALSVESIMAPTGP